MFNLNKNNLHHAYLIEGDRETIFQELLKFLEKDLSFDIKNNPDFLNLGFDNLKIDDSRQIKDFQSKKAIAGDRKIIIIKTDFITVEAQNSLLKIFEEPTENTHFFLIMQSAEVLLPTLKSRLYNLETRFPRNSGAKPPNGFGSLAPEFLCGNLIERFEMIKRFLPKEKDVPADKTLNSWSGKAGAIAFLNELERALYDEYKKDKLGEIKEVLLEINKCRSFLNDRSPSVKMILEHISQIIPKTE